MAEGVDFYSKGGCGVDLPCNEFQVVGDKEFLPRVIATPDKMEREGVQDFISKSDAGQGIFREGQGIAGEVKFRGEGFDALLLCFSE